MIIGLILLPGYLFSDSIQDAQAFENSGRISEALEAYGRWLANNGSHSDAPIVLLHAATLHDDSLEAISYFSKYLHLLPENKRGRIFARMAELEFMLGLSKFAEKHYMLAVKFGGLQVDSWRLQLLIVRFSMGEDVYTEAMDLKETTPMENIAAESALLAAMVRSREEGAARGIDEILRLIDEGYTSPSIWLELITLQTRVNDTEGAEESLRNLELNFPDSVHLYIAQSRIHQWITPSILFSPRDAPRNTSVQIGAFESKVQALRMRERLKFDGFTAWLERSETYWRVIVNNPDGQVSTRLREKGYEVSVHR